MSVERFQVVLELANIEDNDNDKVWFGRWLRRYAVFIRQPQNRMTADFSERREAVLSYSPGNCSSRMATSASGAGHRVLS
jgi:hypothetical protein